MGPKKHKASNIRVVKTDGTKTPLNQADSYMKFLSTRPKHLGYTYILRLLSQECLNIPQLACYTHTHS